MVPKLRLEASQHWLRSERSGKTLLSRGSVSALPQLRMEDGRLRMEMDFDAVQSAAFVYE